MRHENVGIAVLVVIIDMQTGELDAAPVANCSANSAPAPPVHILRRSSLERGQLVARRNEYEAWSVLSLAVGAYPTFGLPPAPRPRSSALGGGAVNRDRKEACPAVGPDHILAWLAKALAIFPTPHTSHTGVVFGDLAEHP